MPTKTLDPRVYCSYSRLVKLQTETHSLPILRKLSSTSTMTGNHPSTSHGRGLDFEELRHYKQGDDIRNMDWKTTMRTGKPHVRTYNEELDRNVIVCLDQRSNMFFSSIDTMKSVVAAELAALVTWRTIERHDRVSLTLLQDQSITDYPATRSPKKVLQQLNSIATANQGLNSSNDSQRVNTFDDLITHLSKRQIKRSVIIVLSDWAELNPSSLQSLKLLQRHNNLIAVMITDPMEQPQYADQLSDCVISNGQQQLNLGSGAMVKQAQMGLLKHFSETFCHVKQLMDSQALPLICVDTNGHHLKQFRDAVGCTA